MSVSHRGKNVTGEQQQQQLILHLQLSPDCNFPSPCHLHRGEVDNRRGDGRTDVENAQKRDIIPIPDAHNPLIYQRADAIDGITISFLSFA